MKIVKSTKQFLFIVIVVLLIVCYPALYRLTEKTVTITIVNKERVLYEGESKYIVWSEHNGVFEDTDSLLFFKFDSSDVYGELDVGKTYCVVVAGWRFRPFSIYPNIIEFCNN